VQDDHGWSRLGLWQEPASQGIAFSASEAETLVVNPLILRCVRAAIAGWAVGEFERKRGKQKKRDERSDQIGE